MEDELLGLQQVVRPGDVCLDVGAAMGIYTAELAALVGPRGAVHSIEPLLFAHATPSALLGLRSGPTVHKHGIALASTDDTLSMSVPMRKGRLVTGRSFITRGTLGLGSNEEFGGHVEVTVPAERLDRFCDRLGLHHVDFIKADVEGAEWDVLRGGHELITRARPRLLLEIEERHVRRFGHTPAALMDWLTGFGYRMFAWQHGGWRAVREVTPQHRNYLFSTTSPCAHG
ncbi:FkbM family methyltransferase [Prauserella shujinwangii]|uniref:FkbM family methyltransferase n=1 Tax=Prauserella shujinwangii TaxID=1453103 RepID=UPI001C62953C|nr:FkbM family methyltransferase [Prauserella shujinwangii]